MKRLKKFIACVMVLGLCLNIVSAQTNTTSFSEEQKLEMKKNMEDFKQTLQLTEVQETEFVAISKKYGQELLQLRESEATKMSKYRKMKSINKSRNKEMKKILSKEQYELYVEKQEEMQKKMRERNRG